MHELVVNLHMHTCYSDGNATPSTLASEALGAGLDAVIVTDHNVHVDGVEDIYRAGDRRLLMLMGEEIHNPCRTPQKSHLLVFGVGRELSNLSGDLQLLVDQVRKAGGISFIAHPVDPASPAIHEPDISWEDWDIQGIHGIELWNGMSEFKSLIKTRLHAFFYAFNPRLVARGPHPSTLKKWDELLASGKRVVAVGGSDAHAFPARLGFVHRQIFPYKFHFRCINTHVLSHTPMIGELEHDRKVLLESLAAGRAFVGYDLPASTRGFRFSAQGRDGSAVMGEEISTRFGVTLQIRLPGMATCHLVKDGKVIKRWKDRQTITYITVEPGVYRVEVYRPYLGRLRGWIFSNPIYLVNA